MFTKSFISKLIFVGLFGLFITNPLFAQSWKQNKPVEFAERNMGGPRLGVTVIPGNGRLVQKLKDEGIGSTISQFGWHFEWQVVPKGGGPSFIVEFIPLVGGVEYGKVIPSATLAMGIRMPNGIEFGIGPNVLIGLTEKKAEGIGDPVKKKTDLQSALTIAVGKSINYSGVSIPINLVYTTNPDGNRISVVFGYAIAK
ncbi:MAG: hypothetical protein D8M58_20535 [Calditrichaeota bacterium]|nr:MAG: hypothetical protein DWQ03_00865 [Calditrichota bacterium]MBL1207798.1 hypothetical protein [Calditrichota bacterium]NOG47632.1 hypothetical protein [Calditrichota bacterium]